MEITGSCPSSRWQNLHDFSFFLQPARRELFRKLSKGLSMSKLNSEPKKIVQEIYFISAKRFKQQFQGITSEFMNKSFFKSILLSPGLIKFLKNIFFCSQIHTNRMTFFKPKDNITSTCHNSMEKMNEKIWKLKTTERSWTNKVFFIFQTHTEKKRQKRYKKTLPLDNFCPYLGISPKL